MEIAGATAAVALTLNWDFAAAEPVDALILRTKPLIK
jgi:hypothetical protein